MQYDIAYKDKPDKIHVEYQHLWKSRQTSLLVSQGVW